MVMNEEVNNEDEVDGRVNQHIDDIIQRLFTLPTINNPPPLPNQPLPPINLRNTIYIPLVIPRNNNYSEDEDPDLQEAIRQSLINYIF